MLLEGSTATREAHAHGKGQIIQLRERDGHRFCTSTCGGSHRFDLFVRVRGRGLCARRKRLVLSGGLMTLPLALRWVAEILVKSRAIGTPGGDSRIASR